MNSLLTHDVRAVYLCIEWLRGGAAHDDESVALRYALQNLTGQSFGTEDEWIHWYDTHGREVYPVPDFDVWLADLKRAGT